MEVEWALRFISKKHTGKRRREVQFPFPRDIFNAAS
jgi:hypothetical protein